MARPAQRATFGLDDPALVEQLAHRGFEGARRELELGRAFGHPARRVRTREAEARDERDARILRGPVAHVDHARLGVEDAGRWIGRGDFGCAV
jgi:hypothetical protein